MRTIRAALFDLGDTLWRTIPLDPPHGPAAAAAQIEASLLQAGLTPNRKAEDLAQALWEAGWQASAGAYHGDLRSPDFPAIAAQVAEDFGLRIDRAAGAALWEAAHGGAALPARALIPGARETLQGLHRRGIAMGLVTNRVLGGALLDAELETYGLRHFFDIRIASCDAGWLKPHPAIFLAAASALGAQPAEVMMVGDSMRADASGAQHAGMTAVWLRPESPLTEDGRLPDGRVPEPDFVINDLRALQDLPIAFEAKVNVRAGAGRWAT